MNTKLKKLKCFSLERLDVYYFERGVITIQIMATIISRHFIIPKPMPMSRDERLAARQTRVKFEVQQILHQHLWNQKTQQGKNRPAYRMMRDLNYYFPLFYGDHKFISSAYNKAVELKLFILSKVYTDASMITYNACYAMDLPNINKLLHASLKTIKLYTEYYYTVAATLDKTLRKLPSEVILDNILCYVVVRPKEFKYIR
jgi:hypothetical protein